MHVSYYIPDVIILFLSQQVILLKFKLCMSSGFENRLVYVTFGGVVMYLLRRFSNYDVNFTELELLAGLLFEYRMHARPT